MTYAEPRLVPMRPRIHRREPQIVVVQPSPVPMRPRMPRRQPQIVLVQPTVQQSYGQFGTKLHRNAIMRQGMLRNATMRQGMPRNATMMRPGGSRRNPNILFIQPKTTIQHRPIRPRINPAPINIRIEVPKRDRGCMRPRLPKKDHPVKKPDPNIVNIVNVDSSRKEVTAPRDITPVVWNYKKPWIHPKNNVSSKLELD